MKARQLWFIRPYQIEIREQVLAPLAAGQILVKTDCSAISAGTEMLVYRGQLPSDIALEVTLESLQQQQSYPLQYGYACVGEVEQVGAEVDAAWLGKQVFAFQPHASYFVTTPEQVMLVPDDIPPEAAVFLANVETAVNLVLDGNPALGERVVVLGQGIVGLLVSGILAQFPLAALFVVESLAERQNAALRLGVDQAFDPVAESEIAALKTALQLPVQLQNTSGSGADLIYEVSGAPEALNLAIDLSSYSGRIVIGSWYGTKKTTVQLGGAAHRNRIKLISSQVSTIAPEISGRWDKSRRFQTAWEMIRRLRPQELITHRVPLAQADAVYQQLDQAPAEVLQAIITY